MEPLPFSLGLTETGFLVLSSSHYVAFRADLDPTHAQALGREQRAGVKRA